MKLLRMILGHVTTQMVRSTSLDVTAHRMLHLCASPTLSRYSREPLPSQMPTPLSLSSFALVAPEMNQSSSSTTPAQRIIQNMG